MNTESLKVLGTIILPVVAMPCILGSYLTYMIFCPDPKDGTLLLAVGGSIAALGGYVGGRIQNRIKIQRLQEECDSAQPPRAGKMVME
jgi:hypothetical protein